MLIVDDEVFARRAVAESIAWADYEIQVFQVSSGEEAMEFMEKHPVDLLMTDIRMSGMSGLELIGKVVEKGWNPAMIVLSSYNDFDLVRSAMKLGAGDYLFKPTMMPKDILESVLQVLAKKKEEGTGFGKEESTKNLPGTQGILKREVRQALAYIEENLGNPDLSLGMVADQIGVSKNYFSRIFKETMKEKFVSYVTRLRMERARYLYLNSDLKIYEISEMVGYSDWHYFYNLYKKTYGHSLSKEKDLE